MSKTLSDLPTDLHRLILSHDEEKIQLEKENEKLKKENKAFKDLIKIHLQRYDELLDELEKFTKQNMDLRELAQDNGGYHPIEQLIEMRGESYVKEVFDEDYEDYKEDNEDEDSDDEEEDEQDE